jgi:hypothetical protein
MPLDHFVPQVHLKNFYSAALKSQMHAMRKSDGKRFSPRAEDVCRIENGNSNSYLTEPRFIEDVLKTVEPNYNRALENLRASSISGDDVYVISGYIACLHATSPTMMRANQDPTAAMVAASIEILDAQGLLPTLPENRLGIATATEAIKRDLVKVQVDPKYCQSVGISGVFRHINLIGNLTWQIIRNEYSETRFFTSDFPSTMEHDRSGKLIARIYPLAPDVAVRLILPGTRKTYVNFDFPDFRYETLKPSRARIIELNRQIVRAAEDLVFYSDEQEWVPRFIQRNSNSEVSADVKMYSSLGRVGVLSRHYLTSRRPKKL